MRTRVIAVIQARLASTRLPGKVLMDICGKPMIQHVVERAQAIPGADKIILAVPMDEQPQWIAWTKEWKRWTLGMMGGPKPQLSILFGPQDDVLARYQMAATITEADVIVRVTGDCPLIAPEVCASVLQLVLDGGVEFGTNDTRWTGWPDGLDCQAFTRSMLERANASATSLYDREHVCTWMEGNGNPCPGYYLLGGRPWPGADLSVDTQEDLDRVRRIMARIPAGDYSWAATKKAIEEEGR